MERVLAQLHGTVGGGALDGGAGAAAASLVASTSLQGSQVSFALADSLPPETEGGSYDSQ